MGMGREKVLGEREKVHTVSDEGAEVPAYDTMPSRTFSFIELAVRQYQLCGMEDGYEVASQFS